MDLIEEMSEMDGNLGLAVPIGSMSRENERLKLQFYPSDHDPLPY